MADSNLYPRDGDQFSIYPSMPDKRLEEENEQRSRLTSSLPVLEDIISWFEDSIRNADSIDNIQLDVVELNGVKYDRKTSIEAQALAYRLLKQHLEEKQAEFIHFSESLK